MLKLNIALDQHECFFIKGAHFFDLNSKTKSIFIPMKQKYKPWVQTSYGLTARANARQDIIIIIRLSKHLTQALCGSHWHFVMLLCEHRKISNFRDNYLRENPELLKQLLIGHVQKYDILFVCPPNFCISIAFVFSWDYCKSRRK